IQPYILLLLSYSPHHTDLHSFPTRRSSDLHELLRVRLPSDRDIAIGEKPIGNEQSVYAIDLREAHIREYHPAKEPQNAEIQQGFTRVLKDALSAMVSGLV